MSPEALIVILALIVALLTQEVGHRRERATLMQRIQAPKQAVAVQAAKEAPPRRRPHPTVSLADDAALVAAAKRRREGVSEEPDG